MLEDCYHTVLLWSVFNNTLSQIIYILFNCLVYMCINAFHWKIHIFHWKMWLELMGLGKLWRKPELSTKFITYVALEMSEGREGLAFSTSNPRHLGPVPGFSMNPSPLHVVTSGSLLGASDSGRPALPHNPKGLQWVTSRNMSGTTAKPPWRPNCGMGWTPLKNLFFY